MKRHEDWSLRLDRFLTERAGTPFQWGHNDCAMFAADAVRAMTGEDLARPLRGYHDAGEAAWLMRSHDGLREIVNGLLHEAVPPAFARRGDVVLVNNAKREALAICIGERWIGPGDRALVMGSMADAVAAWRV